MYAIRSYYAMSKILHENVGDYVSESKADILICYGNNSRYIAEKAKSNGMQDVMFSESKSVITSYSIHYTKLYENSSQK